MNNNECIFCNIVNKKLPSINVYEDENTYAFLDINPDNIGHTIIVPKKHFRNIFDIDENIFCELFKPLKKLSVAIKKATGASGVKIVINNEKASGQIIFHTHIHIIPKYSDKDNEPRDIKKEDLALKIKKELV